jgi:hypothetical protein
MATPITAGEMTTWGSTGAWRHDEAEIYPLAEDETLKSIVLELGEANLLAKDSSDTEVPSLGNRRSSCSLHELPPP